ncbi:alpha/beta hydrolase-fold protein [Micromonospora sp. NBC_01655]|uniref:alpha/beta hydrolase-fold protein n=1 Tax=Micromonospora sp. NBC_01655 TaxID=2975983 RepID=UPI002251F7C8|nr:alpha/beta hydrolase-fold protein [Micromonospora sp. NBC_01655]MCX4472856.1 alpha/beta hydrolase-fold protein [Micromonospora sp. NBC_01655]
MPETSPRIDRLLHDLSADGAPVLAEFWREVADRGTPLVERVDSDSALVTFLWRGEAAQTSTGWGINLPLRRVPGTDVWHGSERLPLDLHTIYFLRHGATDLPTDATGRGPTHLDPLNHHPFRFPADPADPNDRELWASLLELPRAPDDPWSRPRPGVPRGTLLSASVRTTAWGGRRRVAVYRPAAAADGPLPLLVVFDGYLARALLRVPTTLDNLIAAGRIPPTMALFVTASSGTRRIDELRPSAALRAFVTRDLLPWARRRWPVTDDPARRVVAGSSLGGLAAAYVALAEPGAFGAVIAQSGSFWWPASAEPAEREWLTRAYAGWPAAPVRFYLDVGDRENTCPRPGQLDQLSVSRRFRDLLVARGHQVSYAEYRGGHDYVNWRRTFADGLRTVLGAGRREPAPPGRTT